MTNQPDKDEEAAEKYAKSCYWDVASVGKARIEQDVQRGIIDFLAGCKYKGERILEEAKDYKEFGKPGESYILFSDLKKIIGDEPTPPQPEGEG